MMPRSSWVWSTESEVQGPRAGIWWITHWLHLMFPIVRGYESHPILSYPILSYPILSIISYHILSYPIDHILSCSIRSCPITIPLTLPLKAVHHTQNSEPLPKSRVHPTIHHTRLALIVFIDIKSRNRYRAHYETEIISLQRTKIIHSTYIHA